MLFLNFLISFSLTYLRGLEVAELKEEGEEEEEEEEEEEDMLIWITVCKVWLFRFWPISYSPKKTTTISHFRNIPST